MNEARGLGLFWMTEKRTRHVYSDSMPSKLTYKYNLLTTAVSKSGPDGDKTPKRTMSLASSPGSLLKNGGRREPGNIRGKSCRLPAPCSGGTNQIAERNHVYT